MEPVDRLVVPRHWLGVRCKVVLHAKLAVGCRHCHGIECVPKRVEISNGALQGCFPSSTAPRWPTTCSRACRSTPPTRARAAASHEFSHIYVFDRVFSRITLEALATVLERSNFYVMVSSKTPRTWWECGLTKVQPVAKMRFVDHRPRADDLLRLRQRPLHPRLRPPRARARRLLMRLSKCVFSESTHTGPGLSHSLTTARACRRRRAAGGAAALLHLRRVLRRRLLGGAPARPASGALGAPAAARVVEVEAAAACARRARRPPGASRRRRAPTNSASLSPRPAAAAVEVVAAGELGATASARSKARTRLLAPSAIRRVGPRAPRLLVRRGRRPRGHQKIAVAAPRQVPAVVRLRVLLASRSAASQGVVATSASRRRRRCSSRSAAAARQVTRTGGSAARDVRLPRRLRRISSSRRARDRAHAVGQGDAGSAGSTRSLARQKTLARCLICIIPASTSCTRT